MTISRRSFIQAAVGGVARIVRPVDLSLIMAGTTESPSGWWKDFGSHAAYEAEQILNTGDSSYYNICLFFKSTPASLSRGWNRDSDTSFHFSIETPSDLLRFLDDAETLTEDVCFRSDSYDEIHQATSRCFGDILRALSFMAGMNEQQKKDFLSSLDSGLKDEIRKRLQHGVYHWDDFIRLAIFDNVKKMIAVLERIDQVYPDVSEKDAAFDLMVFRCFDLLRGSILMPYPDMEAGDDFLGVKQMTLLEKIGSFIEMKYLDTYGEALGMYPVPIDVAKHIAKYIEEREREEPSLKENKINIHPDPYKVQMILKGLEQVLPSIKCHSPFSPLDAGLSSLNPKKPLIPSGVVTGTLTPLSQTQVRPTGNPEEKGPDKDIPALPNGGENIFQIGNPLQRQSIGSIITRHTQEKPPQHDPYI